MALQILLKIRPQNKLLQQAIPNLFLHHKLYQYYEKLYIDLMAHYKIEKPAEYVIVKILYSFHTYDTILPSVSVIPLPESCACLLPVDVPHNPNGSQ